MSKLVIALLWACLCCLLSPTDASAWGYKGHRVVGSIAQELLSDNAKTQVRQILNPTASPDTAPTKLIDLRKAGPWADCVKSVELKDGHFKYKVDEDHYEYEVPCTPFRNERDLMEDYASRNWTTCPYPSDISKPQRGCHNTFHFDDVAIERDRFDRTYQGSNEHDLVAAINATIAVLANRPMPQGFAFSIKSQKEALLLLTHFIGDLHQPLHVGSVYLDKDGNLVDPDLAHRIDPATETVGGNSIQDENESLHAEWDDIPTDLGDAKTRELMVVAKRVPATPGPIEDWAAIWATESLLQAREVFSGLAFKYKEPPPPSTDSQWVVAFDDHTAYLWMADQIKRRQLAKGGARLAHILNTIWP
jgi:hypothetical protein